LAILGGVLLFAVVAFAKGMTAGWFRYFISAVPLSVILAGLCLAPSRYPREVSPSRAVRVATGIGAVLAAIALLGPSLITSGRAMDDPKIGREEWQHLGVVFHPNPSDPAQQEELGRFHRSGQMARYIDGLHLPNGSVIVDTFTPCIPYIVLASRHPKQFVITNDSDFKPILADPVTFKARYLLVPVATGLGQLDAINKAYPGIYDTGAGIATRAREFTGPGCPNLRLLAVNS
jgi:hypothetical protein